MDESSNISPPNSGSDCLTSDLRHPAPETTPPTISIPERKLTIRAVPVEYIPPTPPPSASLPAIPPRRQYLAPVGDAYSKRASAPASSWTAPKALDETTVSEGAPAPSKAPVLATVPKVIKSAPPNVPVGDADDGTKVPTMVLMSPSHSAIHVPTAAKQMKQSTPEKPERYGAELLPGATPGSSRPRCKSGPGQPKTTLKPPPVTLRKSPSIGNPPVHVSRIDFGSSASDEDGEDENETEPYAPSIPDELEGHAQRPSHARMVSNDSDLSHWAPEPVCFPNQYASVSYSVNRPPAPRMQWSRRSGSSASQSLRSKDRESILTESTSTRRRRAAPPENHTDTLLTERVQRDVHFTIRALTTPEMFSNMLSDPLARQRFREFLAGDATGTAELDFWTDAQFLAQSMEQLRANGLAFRDLYVSNSGEPHVPLPLEVRRDLLGALQHVIAADASFGSTQARLLESMYNDQFQRFITQQIIQEMHVTLGKANLKSQASEGLGETFILTNPRLPDHPIVLVSDGFVEVTGYPKAQVIGRNCRFLQGPGTPPESVQRIRDGLNSGKGCTELLLNYRRNGEPFYCLLCIIPVRDPSGAIVYFIGGQTNVTGLLATDKVLWLNGTNTSSGAPQLIQMSPALALLRGNAPATDPGAGSQPRPAHGGGFFRGLFGRGGEQAGTATARPDGKQAIASAEATMNEFGAHGLQDQYALFQNTYNKILIFKFKKREIMFVSPQMLAFLGLPTRTQNDLHSSPLIHNDIARLVTAGKDRNETQRLREELKDNIRRGTPCSLYCAIEIPGKGIITRTDSAQQKFGMMHLTPIKDGDNVAVAFVVIFGT
ncbi:hypothetical protein MVEN_00485500 [Mycena venus]|uniref:RGS domain-containing protein n=1 Tax=Mycena venus TaxID=2733690 RepID=A0A8H6YVQ3_9AGAR|nr:hypothetical protein MVEN_00485500 [Mycena venus]